MAGVKVSSSLSDIRHVDSRAWRAMHFVHDDVSGCAGLFSDTVDQLLEFQIADVIAATEAEAMN